MEAAAYHLDDPCFGLHFGASLDPLDAGALAYVAANSPSLSEALENFVTYVRTFNEAARSRTSTQGDLFYFDIKVVNPNTQNVQQPHEMILAAVMNMSRMLVGQRISPQRVEFKHNRKEDIDEFERYFGAPVRFGRRRNAIFLERSVVELTCRNADPRLLKILKAHCDELLAKLGPDTDLIDQVEHLISAQLTSGALTAKSVAKKLGMSERTFARRLAERGTTYGQILNDTRRRLAERCIREPGARTKQVAFMLGYTEPATFTNAFRRWTGKSPTEYRAEAS